MWSPRTANNGADLRAATQGRPYLTSIYSQFLSHRGNRAVRIVPLFSHNGDTEDTEILLRRQGFSVPLSHKIPALPESILPGEILGAHCVLAVDAGRHFHREGARDAKKRQGENKQDILVGAPLH